ncbi:hypothetical protein K439DRAFT_1663690 [Ramaria rubella]|nr:hypothetical protein K439DRAFT_1663690 [Ramaria rubella]
MTSIITSTLSHVLLPTEHLPLRWVRLPFLLATLGLSCVCIAVGAQALDRTNKLENALMAEAQSIEATIMFDMNDVKATTGVLTAAASLLALASLVFSLSLAFDWINHLLNPKPKQSAKERKIEDEDMQSQRPPFSTRTLGFQTAALSFLTVWMFAVLIPSTIFVRTRSAHMTIQDTIPNVSLLVDTRYWDYGFLRCLGAAPWFSVIFSIPATIVTWAAWKFSPSPRALHNLKV